MKPTHDIIMARSRAIHHFGEEAYWRMVEHATTYCNNHGYPLPPQGVEATEDFWMAVGTIMHSTPEQET